MKILVLNSGSSSQKACLYHLNGPPPDAPPKPLWKGNLEWREDRATLEVHAFSGAATKKDLARGERSAATEQLLQALISGETGVLKSLSEIDVAGHRIVNGGRAYNHPTVITPEVQAAIE